ncbi:hypothetical protein J2Z50_006693 [Ensifer mexicanus]|nr:hypothetical protein [Sinorhizobium mexicanum]
MQSDDVIEVVTPFGGGISEVTLFTNAAAVLAGTAGVLVEQGRILDAVIRHRSSLDSDVALVARRVEMPPIGRDCEITGVPCRNLSLSSRAALLTQDVGPQTVPHDIESLPAAVKFWAAAVGAPDGGRGKATDHRPNAARSTRPGRALCPREPLKSSTRVGVRTPVRIIMVPVSGPVDGNSADPSNSIVTIKSLGRRK